MREFLQGWIKDIFGSGLFSSVESVLKINPSSGDYSSVWELISKIYDGVCVPIGITLVLIYFMSNIIEKSTQQQQLDLEHVIKSLLKLFVGLYFIEHGLELMATIYSLSFSFVNEVLNVQGDKFKMGAEIQENVWTQLTGEEWEGKWGFLDSITIGIPVLLELIIPWICSIIMKIVVNFVCYTRLIELYIKTATAPIALSDFFLEGTHSNGWKFLKGYIAVAIQAGIIMLAVVIFNSIAGGIVDGAGNGYWAFLFKYLALGFATIGIMLKSLSLSKEIVGAN